MISIATENNIGSQVSSNFSFSFSTDFYRSIVESGLEHLIIAMDGIDPATYSKYRVNGRYELVEAGMHEIIKWKRRLKRRLPLVEWQFIIFDHNKHQIPAVRQMAQRIGVDRLCLKYDGRTKSSSWRPIDRFKNKALRAIHLNSCLWLWGAMVINTDGIVSPCCHAGHAEQIGNLNVVALRTLWNTERMMALRACVRNGVSPGCGKGDVCAGCQHIF